MEGTPKKNLSILIATFWDYPHTGGLSNYITTLKEGLTALGHHVDVISPAQFPERKVTKLREIVVPELKEFFTDRYGSCSSKILQSTRLLYIYEQMMKSINLKKYDILHAQDIFTANILGRFNEEYNKPLLFTPHGMFTFSRVKFNRIQKGSVEESYYLQTERQAIQYASHIVVISDSFRTPLESLGAKQENMTTINTGISMNTRPKVKANQQKLILSCVARLGPRKGHTYMFDALAKIKKFTKNVEVLIVGDGEMRSALEAQVKNLQLDNVHFLGKRDDVPEILSKTDIFILPTINDNLPISIIEAMHSGTAVISTNCGGIPELIQDKITGILVEPADAKSLAKQIQLLIKSPSHRQSLGENAQLYAQKHLTSEAMVSGIFKQYISLLTGKEEE